MVEKLVQQLYRVVFNFTAEYYDVCLRTAYQGFITLFLAKARRKNITTY